MADVYTQPGGTQMRPDRSFRFENGKLVVELDVAAGIEDYDGFAWPELTVTTASSPAVSAAGPVGPTPATSIGDDLYAYGQFGGEWSVGIRLTGSRPIAALYDNTHRAGSPVAGCGRSRGSRTGTAPGRVSAQGSPILDLGRWRVGGAWCRAPLRGH